MHKPSMNIQTVLLCIVLATGCWADEMKQPAVVSDTSSTTQDTQQDNLVVTSQVDPKTGQTYQELKGSFIVEKFNRQPSEHGYKIGINNIFLIVGRGSKDEGLRTKIIQEGGSIHYPNGLLKSPERDIDWSLLKGKKANIYCRIANYFESTKSFCDRTHGLWSCSPKGDLNFQFDYTCHLGGKAEYTLNFE